jgi:hypothetical protein
LRPGGDAGIALNYSRICIRIVNQQRIILSAFWFDTDIIGG